MGENTVKNTRGRGLKPAWKKGDPSPNPSGHPKGQRNYATIYRDAMILLAKRNNSTPEALETEMIANGAVLARKGDYRFFKDVLDRLHGTPVQKFAGEITLPKPIADVFVNNGVQNSNSNAQDSEPQEKN